MKYLSIIHEFLATKNKDNMIFLSNYDNSGEEFVKLTTEEIIALAEALKVNKSVTGLYIGDISIEEEGAIALGEALKVNDTLESLELIHTKMCDTTAIAEALHFNKKLSSLSIIDAYMGDVMADEFSQALKVNTTLTTLELIQCLITYSGAASSASSLKFDHNIKNRDLSHNIISEYGAIAFAEALGTNDSRMKLELKSMTVVEDYDVLHISESGERTINYIDE